MYDTMKPKMIIKREDTGIDVMLSCAIMSKNGACPTKIETIHNNVHVVRESEFYTRKVRISPLRSDIVMDNMDRYRFNISKINKITINKLLYRLLDFSVVIYSKEFKLSDVDIYRNKEYDLYVYAGDSDNIDDGTIEMIYDGHAYTLKYKLYDEYVDIATCDIMFHMSE